MKLRVVLLRRALTLVALLCGVAMVAIGAGSAAAAPVDSLQSHGQSILPGYQGIDDVDTTNLQPGDVVPGTMREIPSTYCIDGARAYQYQYVTTNRDGSKTVAVGSVIVPRAGSGTTMIVNDPYNSITQSSTASLKVASTGLVPNYSVINGLHAGSIVVVPDYLGKDGMYGATNPAGRSTLDATRAAQRHFGMVGSPTYGRGISGGAMSMGRAAELQPTYAPDLNLVVVQLVATPANFWAVTQRMNNSEANALLMAAAIGNTRSNPQLAAHLPRGARLMASLLRVGDWPLEAVIPLGVVGLRMETVTQDPYIWERPDVQAAIAENNLGQSRPNAKVMIVNPARDPWIDSEANNLWLAQRYRDLGADVTVVTVEGLIWPSHVMVDPLADTLLFSFVNTTLGVEQQLPVPPGALVEPLVKSPLLYDASYVVGDTLRLVARTLGLVSNPIASMVIEGANQVVDGVQGYNRTVTEQTDQAATVTTQVATDAQRQVAEGGEAAKTALQPLVPPDVADQVARAVDDTVAAVNRGITDTHANLQHGLADAAAGLRIPLPAGVVD